MLGEITELVRNRLGLDATVYSYVETEQAVIAVAGEVSYRELNPSEINSITLCLFNDNDFLGSE